MKYFLGIDIGTYESKGALVDERGNLVASDSVGHLMEAPLPGYAEHDAEGVWWHDFCTLSRSLIQEAGIQNTDITAVGCSTIAPCCLPVDENLELLRKAILYGIDVRCSEEIRDILAADNEDDIVASCGASVTSQSAAAKILWIRNHEPEVYGRTSKFITGTTYLVAKLTGSFVIDNYTASTFVPIYDVKACDWKKDIAAFCKREQLADCRWTNETAGRVTRTAAEETGLAEGTLVTVGTADASAEAVSEGVTEPGDMMIMYGSSIFMINIVNRFVPDKRLWASPFLFKGTYTIAAGMSTAGTLTRWFRDQLARDLSLREGSNVYDALAKGIENIAPGSGGLVVLPYFSGERTPINDAQAKGMIFGLNLTHTREHLYQACLEGIGYGIGQHFEIFKELDVFPARIMAVGGGLKTRKWIQMVSDIIGCRQDYARVKIGAAYGDALLAMLAVGAIQTKQDLKALVQPEGWFTPDEGRCKAYLPYRVRYGQLYQATKEIMHSY